PDWHLNGSAREAWAECYDPKLLLNLLKAGRADIRSQRLAATIIVQAADKRLPQPRIDIKWRNRWVALELYRWRERGHPPGKAQAAVAEIFRLSVETVRKIDARADLRREAFELALCM